MSQPHTSRVRASDAEREQVADRLRAAMEEGRLILDEGEQRLAAAYAVTYRDELPELIADLPPAEPPAGGLRAGRSRGWAGGGRLGGGRLGGGWPRPAAGMLVVGALVAGLLVVGAVVTGLWAAAASGSVWPAILIGVFAVMLLKRGRRRHGAGSGNPCHRRPEPEPEPDS
jgi:hypothetical protein